MRVAWDGGEARLSVEVPEAMAVAGDDLTQFVPVALMLAMRRGEPLGIDGPVDAGLCESLALAQETLSAWSPTFTRVPVRVAGHAPPGVPAAGHGCCYSRGLDSTYSASRPRPPGRELTHLVYGEDVDPSYSAATRDARVAAARAGAEALGLPLAVTRTNARELLDHVIDHTDSYGAVLAMVGLSLAPQLGSLTIASSRDLNTLMPRGSHPMLDPLWSSARVAIEHDSMVLDRPAKARWLVENRPDLLPHLHVCWETDAARNCGTCFKCTTTAVALHIAGGLEQAGSLPPRLNLDDVRAARDPALMTQLGQNDTYRAIPPGPEFDDVRDAVAEVIRESARISVADDPSPHGIFRHQARLLDAILRGEPYTAMSEGPRAIAPEVGPLGDDWPPAPVAAPEPRQPRAPRAARSLWSALRG